MASGSKNGNRQEVEMKKRVFVMLLSPMALALLAFAQQPNSDAKAQAPVQNVGTTCKEPLQPASSKDFWNGDEPGVANLVGHGITSKKDVQKITQPIQNCLNDLSDAANAHTRMIKDVDARTQQGLQLAATKANEADPHNSDAATRANAAHQLATQTTTRLSTVERTVDNLDHYNAGAQTEIQFRPGQSVLSKTAKDALDQMAAPLKDQHNYILEVRGYSPGRGQAAIADSQKMADSVVRYLVQSHQIPVHRIFVVGMGNATAAAKGETTAKHTSRGRVEISLLRNDLASSEQH
jgi:outer membrane protein OmpA-like peptidoglycan-associated protein